MNALRVNNMNNTFLALILVAISSIPLPVLADLEMLIFPRKCLRMDQRVTMTDGAEK